MSELLGPHCGWHEREQGADRTRDARTHDACTSNDHALRVHASSSFVGGLRPSTSRIEPGIGDSIEPALSRTASVVEMI
jgi:hypothetical protein